MTLTLFTDCEALEASKPGGDSSEEVCHQLKMEMVTTTIYLNSNVIKSSDLHSKSVEALEPQILPF